MRNILLALALVAASVAARAQQPPAFDAQQICTREFGDQFKVAAKFAPMTLDLDGDNQEDLVLVATGKNPLAGEADYHYRAIDPYDAYFGWGRTKDTVQFSATNATTTYYVLVLHNWRAPRAKFVIINLPFDTLTSSRVAVKKNKAVNSIHAVEMGGLASDVYWDGKKYKWAPSYIESEQTSAR